MKQPRIKCLKCGADFTEKNNAQDSRHLHMKRCKGKQPRRIPRKFS